MKSQKQIQRQKHRDAKGKYDKVFPCYACGKSAGEDYFSHQLTDSNGSDGVNWGDTALCLCQKCAAATQHLTTVNQFHQYCKNLKS